MNPFEDELTAEEARVIQDSIRDGTNKPKIKPKRITAKEVAGRLTEALLIPKQTIYL